MTIQQPKGARRPEADAALRSADTAGGAYRGGVFWLDRRTADVVEGERTDVVRQGRPEDALLGPHDTRHDAEVAAAGLRRRQGREQPNRWEPEPWESWDVRKQQLRAGYPLQLGAGLAAIGVVGVIAGLGLGETVLTWIGVVMLGQGTVLMLIGWSLRR